ncbi:ATP-binding protein [Comamonas composti]|uniref:ATP-binding protein n=1 Tax=Comamonas composti TaxID=408558 RepID=UPI00042A91C9|nr:ATP-binding protein [Comamonas composti]
MSIFSPFSRRLYLRIWLAVACGLALFTLVIGYAWRVAAERNAQTVNSPPPREFVITDAQGQPMIKGLVTRLPGNPDEGLEFRVDTVEGEVLSLQMSPRKRSSGPPSGGGGRHGPFWLRPSFDFLWLLALVSIAVTLGVFPVIRRLLQRLETLQRGVQRFGEGDLSVRVAEQGQDEVADLARQFNAAAARVETLVTSHKTLLANASHELRSPLTRIRMGLEFMGSDPASARAGAEIQRNIEELDQLVDEILLASRLESHEADVGTMECVDLIGLAAEECARVDAELDVQTDGSLEVPGIAKLLRRAVRNLLENARRYSHGDVTLTLRTQANLALVLIEDHGPGVPEEQRERIFEKFYRLPGASERSGGVGLGLSLVRSIAQRHGGSVHCAARADGEDGACFVLSLPVAPR